MISLSTIVKTAGYVRYRNLGGEGVVMNQEAGKILVLNEVATRLFELFDGRRSIEELVGRLEEEYEVEPQQLRRDVVRYLEELIEHDLVEAIGSSRAGRNADVV